MFTSRHMRSHALQVIPIPCCMKPAGQGRAGQGTAGAGQNRTRENRAGQDRAEQRRGSGRAAGHENNSVLDGSHPDLNSRCQ